MKRPKMSNIIYISAVVIWVLVLVLRWPRLEKEHNINRIHREVEENIQEIELLQQEHQSLQNRQTEIHNQANLLREENKALINELYKEWNEDVMELICEKAPDSPMCWDYKMLTDLKDIASNKWLDYRLLLWIMYAESHIGSSFAPHYWCRESKNWAWLKWAKYGDWSVSERYNNQYPNLDQELQWSLSWCYLYYYEDYNQFFESLTNTIKLWYVDKWADTPEEIVKYYVWNYSQNWIDNVNQF